jgi:hypothetical protein
MDAWADLPEAIRAGILAMVRACLHHPDNTENPAKSRTDRRGEGPVMSAPAALGNGIHCYSRASSTRSWPG